MGHMATLIRSSSSTCEWGHERNALWRELERGRGQGRNRKVGRTWRKPHFRVKLSWVTFIQFGVWFVSTLSCSHFQKGTADLLTFQALRQFRRMCSEHYAPTTATSSLLLRSNLVTPINNALNIKGRVASHKYKIFLFKCISKFNLRGF